MRPVNTRGKFGAKNVNVRAQHRDPDSLLRWFENLVHTLRTAPEIGTGDVLDRRRAAPQVGAGPSVRCGVRLDPVVAQPGRHPVTIDIGRLKGLETAPYDLLVDGPYDAPTRDFTGLALHGWGYRWIRLARSDHG